MSARGYRESSRVEKLETDIAIMGGGGSGLTAAVAAAEKGAKVIVLEKRKTPGGNSAMAMGLFGVESPVQERMRIEARRDEFFKIAMDYSHWKINPRIVRAFVDKSGDTIRWLEEKGVCFDRVARFYPTQFHPVYHCPRVTKGREGAEVVRVLVKNSKDLGVRFLLQTSAKRI